ncbi:uncharacterized protein LOC125024587 [Penaeus chinensis]|uniref:uncharacterized protein LOC125024587 n=1 Tax=Penaeus chinensis TaxID=139456 RepID=UPI001FB65114|nr:uncharacterized protein LOC125024587 [Penaeus chinensis]XP_047468350.1 uncharacterized protein LOC125024587 [Penaeus chinensis]
MAKGMEAAPIVIKLYSKPEVPQVTIDIKNLFSDRDKCENESESSFSGFESEDKPGSSCRKKRYVKKSQKRSQKQTFMERSYQQTNESMGGYMPCTCGGDTSIVKLSGPRKYSLSERQIIEKTGSPQTMQPSKVVSPPGTSITSSSRSNHCDTNQSKANKYIRKVIVLHKDFFDIPYMTPNKHGSLNNRSPGKKSYGLIRDSNCQKNYKTITKKVSFVSKTGQASELSKDSNCLVKIDGNKKCNVYRFVHSERTVEKSSSVLYSSQTNSTHLTTTLSQALLPKILPSNPNVTEDVTTVGEVNEHNDVTPSCFPSEHDYCFSSATSLQGSCLNCKVTPVSHTACANVSRACQSFTSKSSSESAQGSEDFTCRETEAAQIMLDLFYSGSSADVENNGCYDPGARNLEKVSHSAVIGDEHEGPEERAETNEHAIPNNSSLHRKSCHNLERMTDIQPLEGILIASNNLRRMSHYNHGNTDTLNVDRPPRAGLRSHMCSSLRKLVSAQKLYGAIGEVKEVPSVVQKSIVDKQRIYKRATDDIISDQKFRNVKKKSNKVQTSYSQKCKRFQSSLVKSSEKSREIHKLKEKIPGRSKFKEYHTGSKVKRSKKEGNNNEELVFTYFQNENDQSCESEDSLISGTTDADEITTFRYGEMEIGYKASNGGLIEARIPDGNRDPVEQHILLSALGLNKRQNPRTCKLQDISPSHIVHRTGNITAFVRRLQECQIVLKDCCKILKNKEHLSSDVTKNDRDEDVKSSPVRETETTYTNLYSPVSNFSFEGFPTPDIEIAEDFTMSDLECGEELRYPATTAKREDDKLRALDSFPQNRNIQEPRGLFRGRTDYEDANTNKLHSEGGFQQMRCENKVNKLQKGNLSQNIDKKCNPEQVSQPVISSSQEAYSSNENSCPGVKDEQGEGIISITKRNEVIRNRCLSCGKSCFTKAKLKRHVTRNHGIGNQFNQKDEISHRCRGPCLEATMRKSAKLEMSNVMLIHSTELITASKPVESYEDLSRALSQKNCDNNNNLEIPYVNMQDEKVFCMKQKCKESLMKGKERIDKVNLSSGSCQIIEPCIVSNMTDNTETIASNSPQKRKLKSTLEDNSSLCEQLRVLLEPYIKKEETIIQGRDLELWSNDGRTETIPPENILISLLSPNHPRYEVDKRNTKKSQQKNFANEVNLGPEQKEGLFPVSNREGKKVICRRKRHRTIVINGKRWYPCSVCKHKFSTSGDLSRHMRKHTGERPYKCLICSSSFKEKGALNRHNEVHKGSRPYACRICDSKFTQKIHLKTHLRIHTGEKPFRCEQCGKVFSRVDHLKGHLNTHTSDRPYKCKICFRAFKCCANLSNHKRTHDEYKHYKCQYCPAAFRVSNSLKVHLRFHTIERQVNCQKLYIENSLRKQSVSKLL